MQTAGTTVKKVQLPNGEVYAYREIDNSSPVMLLIHGNYYSSITTERFIGRLLSNDFHVIALDLRGNGQSTYNNPINDIDDFVEDVKQFVDALGLKKFFLLGWSMGGLISMKFTARYGDYVEKLILQNPCGVKGFPTCKVDEQGNLTTERAQTEEEVLNSFWIKQVRQDRANQDREKIKNLIAFALFPKVKLEPEYLESVADDFFTCGYTERSFYVMNKYNISNEHNGVSEGTNEISKIKCKVLILHGEEDLFAPYKESENIKELLKDQVELKLFKNAGHCVFTDYPEECVAIVKEFCLGKSI